METLRSFSKQNFKPETGVDFGALNTGCLQRIADATELMAAKYIQIQKDLEYYKERAITLGGALQAARRSNSILKGHITRLKNKQKAHCPGCNCVGLIITTS